MENLALNCTVTQLLKVIEESQIHSGNNIIKETSILDKIIETDYNNYSELDKLKFLINNNKLIDTVIFNNFVAKDDKDKMELAEFYNKMFANTILDILPDPFYFQSKINAELSTIDEPVYYITDSILINGLAPNESILVECENGEIDVGTPSIINNESYLDESQFTGYFSSSKVIKSNNNGNILLKSRGKTSTNYETYEYIAVGINRVYAYYYILTKSGPPDSLINKPNEFEFKNITNAELNKEYISDPVFIGGFDPEELIKIEVTNGTFDSGNGQLSGNFSSSSIIKTNILGNIYIRAKGMSAQNYNTTTEIIVTINGHNTTFQIQTKPNPNNIV